MKALFCLLALCMLTGALACQRDSNGLCHETGVDDSGEFCNGSTLQAQRIHICRELREHCSPDPLPSTSESAAARCPHEKLQHTDKEETQRVAIAETCVDAKEQKVSAEWVACRPATGQCDRPDLCDIAEHCDDAQLRASPPSAVEIAENITLFGLVSKGIVKLTKGIYEDQGVVAEMLVELFFTDHYDPIICSHSLGCCWVVCVARFVGGASVYLFCGILALITWMAVFAAILATFTLYLATVFGVEVALFVMPFVAFGTKVITSPIGIAFFSFVFYETVVVARRRARPVAQAPYTVSFLWDFFSLTATGGISLILIQDIEELFTDFRAWKRAKFDSWCARVLETHDASREESYVDCCFTIWLLTVIDGVADNLIGTLRNIIFSVFILLMEIEYHWRLYRASADIEDNDDVPPVDLTPEEIEESVAAIDESCAAATSPESEKLQSPEEDRRKAKLTYANDNPQPNEETAE